MDRNQADAIADAILEPDPASREAIARKRAAYQRSLAERRLVALFMLPGCATGAAAAYLAGMRFTEGVIWGGVAGGAIGWSLVIWRRARAVARRLPRAET
jgi:hypothetical protein